jgi:hypothetical protein
MQQAIVIHNGFFFEKTACRTAREKTRSLPCTLNSGYSMVESGKQKKSCNKYIVYYQLDTTIRQLRKWTLFKIRQKMHKKSVDGGCPVWSTQKNTRILSSEKTFCQATEKEDQASVDKENCAKIKSFCLAFAVNKE